MRVDTHTIDRLLDKMSTKARTVSQASELLREIPIAAQKSRASMNAIGGLLCEGRLTNVELVAGTSGDDAFLVDSKEIRSHFPIFDETLPPGKTAAAKLMGIKASVLDILTDDTSGSALVRKEADCTGNGVKFRVAYEEIGHFQKIYVTLDQLMGRTGWHRSKVQKILQLSNVIPCIDPLVLKMWLFRVQDISGCDNPVLVRAATNNGE